MLSGKVPFGIPRISVFLWKRKRFRLFFFLNKNIPVLRILLFISFAFLAQFPLRAQGDGRVFNRGRETLFQLEQGQVADSGKIRFTIKGNVIFNGNSSDRDSIAYMLKTRGIFSRKISYLYYPDADRVKYSISRGVVYYGRGLNSYNQLLKIVKEGEKNYRFYAGEEWQEVALALGDFSEAELMAVAVSLLKLPDVSEIAGPLITEEQLIPSEGILGVIKPAWRNDINSEWTWDGRMLRPRWGARPEDEWIFNGKNIVPYWGIEGEGEWSWDGQVLKPARGEFPDHTYIFDGYTLKPRWDDNPDRVWIIDGDRARPKWINDPAMEYIIEGKVPIPLIALVVLGYADRPR